MRKFVFTQPDQYKLVTSLCQAAGIEDPRTVRRVVVDLEYGKAGRIYVELILDVDICEIGVDVKEDPEALAVGPGGTLKYSNLVKSET
jgi:hypothetical protein